MDTHVKYILLLLVVTVISIGVSSSVKYDKSSIETHPDMPKAHTPDDNHSGLSQENQNKIKLLQSQFTNLNQEVVSLETTLNNTVPILNSSGDINYETGTPTLADVNKLFISESINEVSVSWVYGLWKYISDTFTVEEISGSYQLKVEKDYISFGGSIPGLVVSSDLPANFNFDPSGFLQNVSHEYLVFGSPPNPSHGSKYTFTTESSLVDAYGKYVLKLINATTAGKFSLAVVKLLATPVTTQLYNLEYFGLTTDVNYRVPFSHPGYIKTNDPFSLNTIPQTEPTFTPNGFGMFASVLPVAETVLGDAQTAPTFTSYSGTNLSGFTSSIPTSRYAISVLNSSILNSGSIPEDFQMNIPANTTSYTIPTNGDLFYSINLLFLDDPTTDISNVTFMDKNNIKGVQNVLFVISKNTEEPNYSMLERNIVGQLSTALTIDATITTKQLYNYYSNQKISIGIFFNPCLEENSGTNESIPVYGAWKSAMSQHINYFEITNWLPRPRTHKYHSGKYYPYYFDSNNNLWKSP